AALDWAVANDDADTALMIAGGASWPHWLRGTVIEGKRWLDDAFACGGEADERTRALALTGRGLIDFLAGQPEHSDEDLAAAFETNQTLLGGFTGSLLARLGWVLLEDGQTTRAEAVYEQALASGRRVHHTMVVFCALAGVAALDRIHGRSREAAAAATEALE